MKDKGFAENFEKARFISADRAVNVIIARVHERHEAGFKLDDCYTETVEELNGHAVEIGDLLQKARFGLGLETDETGQKEYDAQLKKAKGEGAPKGPSGP